jgi:hypothetical protein
LPRWGSRVRIPSSAPGKPSQEPLVRPDDRGRPACQTGVMPFGILVQRWRDFYVVGGTAAATLVGLLFVGLSLHLRAVLTRPEVRSLARVTLANFGLLLFVSLFMVIPQGSSTASTELLLSGGISLALITPSLVAVVRSKTRALRLYMPLLRIASSAVGYVGGDHRGALLGRGSYNAALSWLVAVTVVLLFVSLRNSWDLLVSVGADTMDMRETEVD